MARFIAKQVISETLKLLPPNHPSNPTTQPQAAADKELTTNGYTLFDHMERVRFLELSGKEGEAEQLRSIMKVNLPGLEEFVTDERYTTLTGKMAYNAYGISLSGGRDDKVRIFRLLHTHRNFVLMRGMTTVLPCSHSQTSDQKTPS